MSYKVEIYIEGVQKTRIRVPKIHKWRLVWGYIDLGEKPFAFYKEEVHDDAAFVKEFGMGPVRVILSASPERIDWALALGDLALAAGSRSIFQLPYQHQFKGSSKELGILSLRGDLRVEIAE